MNQAVRVVALLQAREGRAAEVERLLLACVQPSRAEDGCLSYVGSCRDKGKIHSFGM